MTAEQRLVQLLSDAHGLETALVATLRTHAAMTPRGEYRALLERHVEETRVHAERVHRRMQSLAADPSIVQLLYGVAQVAIGQAIVAAKLPIDLLRGTSAEERLLQNARDEAGSEALEIATYDAIEAFAIEAGDEETAALARAHRAEEEAFLAELREQVAILARDAYADTGAGRAAVRASRAAREATRRTREVADELRASTGADGVPIRGYDDMTVQQIAKRLPRLSADELARVERHERRGRARKGVLERVAKLRSA